MIAITLASASAARAAILAGAGVIFETALADVDETAIKSELLAADAGPRQIAERLAEAKAIAVSQRQGGLVIGADQTLEIDGALYDKPVDLACARQQLIGLRGRIHVLHAAVSLARDGQSLWRDVESARMTMRTFSTPFLEGYLGRQGDRVLRSVGGYQLEGEGAQLFDRIEGDYFAILGLPLFGLLGALRRHGAIAT
ncbi:MAG TPA: Maf family protein [Caulobacteraceae bacterium]